MTPPTRIDTSAAKPAPGASQRYVYLDAMKGIMILWGIPVHSCTISDSIFFDKIAEISGWVRMEAFFIISGFLSYMLIKRYGGKALMRRRLTAIGVPLMTVLLLLNPVTNFLILKYHNGAAAPGFLQFMTGDIPAGLHGTWNWHLHVWFLVVLLCLASVSSRAIALTDQFIDRARPMLARFPDGFLLLVLSGAVAGAVLLARVFYEVAAKPFTPESYHFPLRAVGYYAWFYVLGMAMFASPRLLRIITRYHGLQLAAAGLLLLAARLMQPHLIDRAGEVFRLMAEAYFALMLATLLFATFKRFFSSDTKVMRFISESAFAVYLLHYLVIYLNAYWLRNFVADGFMLSLLVTVFATGATMLIYEFLIRRSTLLRCLFLGKIPGQKPRPPRAEPLPAGPPTASPTELAG